MPVSNFESVFSELSHSLLSEKAPGLMNYLVGFEVLDASDDSDSPERAAAVFGFKVNKNWLYAPVFFSNGRIKGMDMLYARNQDIFVPLQDDWVSYLLSRQPSELGKQEELEEGDLHGTVPDFAMAVTGNPAKYASAVDPVGLGRRIPAAEAAKQAAESRYETRARHAREIKDTFKAMPGGVTADLLKRAADDACDLRHVIEKAPLFGVALAKMAQLDPKVAGAVGFFYGDICDLLPAPEAVEAAAAKSAGWDPDALPRPDPVMDVLARLTIAQPDNGTVTEVNGRNLPLFKRALAEADITKVILGDTVYHDTRKSAAVLLDVESARTKYAAEPLRVEVDGEDARVRPVDNGSYAVLTADGEEHDCYVAPRLHMPCPGAVSGMALVLDYESGVGRLVDSNQLVVREKPRDETISGGRLKRHTVGADSLEIGKLYSLVLDNTVTVPFQVLAKETSGSTVTLKTALAHDNSVWECTGNSGGHGVMCGGHGQPYVRNISYLCEKSDLEADWDVRKNVTVDGKAYEFHADLRDCWNITLRDGQTADIRITSAGTLVPSDAKFIDCGYPIRERETELVFSNDALWDHVFDQDELKTVKIASTSGGYVVTRGDERHTFSKRSAVLDLMCAFDLREADAREMIAGASAYGRSYMIKGAAGFISNSASAPYPGDDGAAVFSDMLGRAAQAPFEAKIPAQGIGAGVGNDEAYNIFRDPEVQRALGAAQEGKKDVFDVSMVKGLVKTLDVSSMIDEYMPDLIRGMDRVARVLFMFYWHIDKFQERYGRQDVVELEDSLKNIFKGQGDLILFLRRKTVESQPELRSMDMTLGDIAQ
jgi:hypothetical protein